MAFDLIGFLITCEGPEFVKRAQEAGDRRLSEEKPGLPGDDGLQGASPAVGDDGRPAGLGFEGGDAEILLAGQDESAVAPR